MKPNQCPSCGGLSLERREGDFTFNPPPNAPGGAIVVKNVAWEQCRECDESILDNTITKAIREELRRRQELLTADRIKQIRDCLGVSQEAMAAFLNIGKKTYTRWESGRSIQNKLSDTMIRLAEWKPEILFRIEAQRKPDRERMVARYFGALRGETGTEIIAIAAHGDPVNRLFARRIRDCLRELAKAEKEES